MRVSLLSGLVRSGLACSLLLASACSGTVETDDEAPASAIEALRFGHSTPSFARNALRAGANRLCDLQADRTSDNARNGLDDDDPDDGGWDWLIPVEQTAHGTAASPENLYGVTALGVWAAHEALGFHPRWRIAERDAASGADARPEVDSPPDIVYLVLLSEQTHNPAYAALARARYDARRELAGGAVAYATSIRELRHRGNNDGLIAYDIAWLVLGARALDAAFPRAGYAEDARGMADVIVQDVAGSPGYFDVTDPTENYYVQGIAWSLVALANAAGDTRIPRNDLSARLFDLQSVDGPWGWNGDYPDANLQATAEVVQALALSRRRAPVVALLAARWLAGQQLESGGFMYLDGQEAPLLDAEILLALRLVGDGRHSNALLPGPGLGTRSSALLAAPAAAPALASPL